MRFFIQPEQLNRIKTYLSIFHSNGYILDIGSGSGDYDEILSKAGNKIIGIDISKKNLDIAKKRNPKVTYIYGDALTYKFNKKFNAVICFEVLEHIKNEIKLLRQISKITDRLYISSVFKGFHKGWKIKQFFFRLTKKYPFLWKLKIFNPYLDYKVMMKRKGHLREYDLEKFKKMLKTIGFKIVNVKYCYNTLATELIYTFNIPSFLFPYLNILNFPIKKINHIVIEAERIKK